MALSTASTCVITSAAMARNESEQPPDRVPALQFPYAFVNTFPEEQQRMYYDRCVAPETGRIYLLPGGVRHARSAGS